MPKELQLPPGPPPARGLGEELLRLRDLQADVLGVIRQRFAVYGDFYYAPGRVRSYTTCDPELMHEVLVAQARAFGKRTTSLEILGNGLFALSAIVRRFRLTLTDHRPLSPHPRITLAPARAIRVRVATRTAH